MFWIGLLLMLWYFCGLLTYGIFMNDCHWAFEQDYKDLPKDLKPIFKDMIFPGLRRIGRSYMLRGPFGLAHAIKVGRRPLGLRL